MGYSCANAWTTLFVWGNGDVTHCCYSNIGPLGNINKQSLDEIWNSKKLLFVRDNISKGKYIEAGCEQNCRPYRWNRFYGKQKDIPEVPEGLGRLKGFTLGQSFESPAIIGMAMDWKCNFTCTHCQAPRNVDGITEKNIRDIWPAVEKAKIVRIVDGEFTINQGSLDQLLRISQMEDQPNVFMNTNGHIGLDKYMRYIENLKSFHLKFSLEDVGSNYETIRVGGKWSIFKENLLKAKAIFDEKCKQGNDWRLYMNYCIMKSNFSNVPDTVRFAAETGIRLVVNPINGARHIDENISLYGHLRIADEEIKRVQTEVHQIVKESGYFFGKELEQHLDYVIRVIQDKKVNIPYSLLVFIRRYVKGQKADRLFYMWYKWQIDKRSLLIYLSRKIKKRIRAFFFTNFILQPTKKPS